MGGTSFCSGMMEGVPQPSAAAGTSQHTVEFIDEIYKSS